MAAKSKEQPTPEPPQSKHGVHPFEPGKHPRDARKEGATKAVPEAEPSKSE